MGSGHHALYQSISHIRLRYKYLHGTHIIIPTPHHTPMTTKPSFQEHEDYVSQLHHQLPAEWQFKHHPLYCHVLEHVSKDQGNQYLNCIETQFPHISLGQIRDYVNANDKYGGAVKHIYTTQSLRLLYCSASSLRYIYQALMVLEEYSHTDCTHMVELGAGYGGLCLAIHMFAPILLTNHHSSRPPPIVYYMIDLPASCDLIRDYLAVHASHLPFKQSYRVIKAKEAKEAKEAPLPFDPPHPRSILFSSPIFALVNGPNRNKRIIAAKSLTHVPTEC